MIKELRQPIPVITPRGKGWAFFIIDRSQEHYLEWVVFLDDGGCCWTFANPDIRIQDNWTMGRKKIFDFNYRPSPEGNDSSD